MSGIARAFRFGTADEFVQITHIQAIIIVVTVVSMAALTYLINHTELGRACRATQQDRTMANLLGINTDRTISLVFVIGASMAATINDTNAGLIFFIVLPSTQSNLSISSVENPFHGYLRDRDRASNHNGSGVFLCHILLLLPAN